MKKIRRIVIITFAIFFQLTTVVSASLTKEDIKQALFNFQKESEHLLGSSSKRTSEEILASMNSRQTVIGPVLDQNHPVVKHSVFILTKKGNSTFMCSGTVLHHHFVLTAAHCLYGKTRAYIFPNISKFSFQEIFRAFDSKRFFQVEQDSFRISPCYYVPDIITVDSKKCDIALLFVSSPLNTYDPEVTPVPVVTNLGGFRSPFLLVGYGSPASRERDSYLSLSETICELKDSSKYLLATERSRSRGTVPGDSGGPMYTKINGRYAQVAVNVAVSTTTNYSVRVDSHLGWLEKIMDSPFLE